MDRKISVETRLRKLGAIPRKGFRYTVTAVLMILEDEDLLDGVMRKLFTKVAELYHNKPANVERNIRYLIAGCWKQNPQGVIDLIGFEVEKAPTPIAFICALAGELARDECGGRPSGAGTAQEAAPPDPSLEQQ